MNSLPFISHHLFVAAVGHEGRAQARPTRHDRSFAEVAARASAITLEVVDNRNPLPVAAARPVRASIARARL